MLDQPHVKGWISLSILPGDNRGVADAVAVKDTAAAFVDIGATDLVFSPAVDDFDDFDEIARLADIVL